MAKKSEAELADNYNESEDESEFDLQRPESLTVRSNVTISVRFSDEEISELRARAERAGVKVTSFIRAAALEATSPIDRAALGGLVRDLEHRAHEVAAMIGRTPPTGRQQDRVTAWRDADRGEAPPER